MSLVVTFNLIIGLMYGSQEANLFHVLFTADLTHFSQRQTMVNKLNAPEN